MPRLRFSIGALLLLVVVVAVSAALFVEKQRYADLEKRFGDVKRQFGYIDVADPSKIHLRALQCDAQNTWQYRLYVPDDADYVLEFYHNTGRAPIFGEQKPLAPDAGQHTITLQVAEDLLSPGDLSVHCFMVSLDRRAGGISFPRESVRFLAGRTGNYENAAHRLQDFQSHNSKVESFQPGAAIDLLHIKDQSQTPQMINGKPAEIIVRLVPKKASPPSRPSNSAD